MENPGGSELQQSLHPPAAANRCNEASTVTKRCARSVSCSTVVVDAMTLSAGLKRKRHLGPPALTDSLDTLCGSAASVVTTRLPLLVSEQSQESRLLSDNLLDPASPEATDRDAKKQRLQQIQHILSWQPREMTTHRRHDVRVLGRARRAYSWGCQRPVILDASRNLVPRLRNSDNRMVAGAVATSHRVSNSVTALSVLQKPICVAWTSDGRPLLPKSQSASSRNNKAEWSPPLVPPINVASLQELDIERLIRDRQLRHQLIFSQSVTIRPNLSGARGLRRREASSRYWMACQRELETGCRCMAWAAAPSATAIVAGKHLEPLPCRCSSRVSHSGISHKDNRIHASGETLSRLRSMVGELRDIILMIVPADDRDESITESASPPITASIVRGALDQDLLLQQARHGMLDGTAISRFLSEVMKAHCAPLRDAKVDEMVRLFEGPGSAALVDGLKMAFEILEIMIVDIASHQLRSLRPLLLADAARFEYGTFLQSKPSLGRTQAWLQAAQAGLDTSTAQHKLCSDRILRIVCFGFTRLIFRQSDNHLGARDAQVRSRQTSEEDDWPETLSLDVARMREVHHTFDNLTVINLYLLLFRQLLAEAKQPVSTRDTVQVLKNNMLALMRDSQRVSNDHDALQGLLDRLNLQVATAVDSVTAAASVAPSSTLEVVTSWQKRNMLPGQTIWQLVRKRLQNATYEKLLQSAGLTGADGTQPACAMACELSDELSLITSKTWQMAEHNFRTYRQLYADILQSEV